MNYLEKYKEWQKLDILYRTRLGKSSWYGAPITTIALTNWISIIFKPHEQD